MSIIIESIQYALAFCLLAPTAAALYVVVKSLREGL